VRDNSGNASNLIRMCSLTASIMRTITLEQLLDSLLANIYEIEIPDKIREKAELSVKG